MNAAARPHLILFASEQVWPNLHALVHWSTAGEGLGNVSILHTDAPQSREPAERLQAVLTKAKSAPFRFEGLELIPVDTTPAAVASAVREVRRHAPDTPWVVVANGGLKTMTLGLLEAMADEANVQVVYRELGAAWQRVVLRNGQIETIPLADIVPDEMDRLPVVSLITAQHTGEPGKLELTRQEVQLLDVCGVARACMAAGIDGVGWDWRGGFAASGLDPGSRLGPLFERWCGALLRQLGVKNLVGGLEVRVEAKSSAAAESDLLAIHGGRFYYIELKLVDELHEGPNGLVKILRTVTELARSFAGSNAVPILILPNWRLSPEQWLLCDLFFPRPQILDASNSATLISWLAKTLGITDLPPDLTALEAEIGHWMREHGITRAFGSESRAIRDFDAGSTPQAKPAVVGQLAGFTRAYRWERQQNWMLVADIDAVWLEIESEGRTPAPPGFRAHGKTLWKASAPLRADRLLKALKERFRGFVNRRVPVAELVAAWKAAIDSRATGTAPAIRKTPSSVGSPGNRQPAGVQQPSKSAAATSARPSSPRLSPPPESALPSGPGWKLLRQQDGGYFMELNHITKGLSNNEFPEAVLRVTQHQSRPGEPRLRKVFFHPHLPIGEWLKPFNGQLYHGPNMAQALRAQIAARSPTASSTGRTDPTA